MLIEEFVQLVQKGLPKFTDRAHEAMREAPDFDWNQMDEEDWWEHYLAFVEVHGVGGPNGL